jgi:hypothetical protein
MWAVCPAPYISGYILKIVICEESDPDSSHLLYIKDGTAAAISICRNADRLVPSLSLVDAQRR